MDNVTSKWSKIGEVLYKGVDAQAVADEIAAIGKSATAEQIVERAKDEKSELHKCFTWDVQKAAQKCWIQEARNVVGCLVIKREEVKENEPEVRTFHKIDGCGYKPVTQIFKRQDEYQALLQEAYAALQSFKRKYQSLQELDWLISQFP